MERSFKVSHVTLQSKPYVFGYKSGDQRQNARSQKMGRKTLQKFELFRGQFGFRSRVRGFTLDYFNNWGFGFRLIFGL